MQHGDGEYIHMPIIIFPFCKKHYGQHRKGIVYNKPKKCRRGKREKLIAFSLYQPHSLYFWISFYPCGYHIHTRSFYWFLTSLTPTQGQLSLSLHLFVLWFDSHSFLHITKSVQRSSIMSTILYSIHIISASLPFWP